MKMTIIPEIDNIDLRNPELFRADIDEVVNRSLSPEIKWWVERYEAVGQRPQFLWKWCLKGLELTAIPCVDPDLSDWNNNTKLLAVMFDVLLDDIADNTTDLVFLKKLHEIVFTGRISDINSIPTKKRDYAQFAISVWEEIDSRARKTPRFSEYEELLRFDQMQVVNAIQYSALINGNYRAINLTEHDMYSPHNMDMMVHGTLDLMCSSDFDASQLGYVRSLLWNASCMGRIGNLITTWERELYEKDFSSGVYALAIDEGYVTQEELYTLKPEEFNSRIRNNQCEEFFLARWHQHRAHICLLAGKINSFDVMDYVRSFDSLLRIHLGSRGLK